MPYVRREKSYTTCGRTQPVSEFNRIHDRWIRKLSEKLPEGVPASDDPGLDGRPWPATFGDYAEDGVTPLHRPDEGDGHLFQCEACVYYIGLESRLGMDWGACTNPRSEYDGRVTFEHWTCREFTP